MKTPEERLWDYLEKRLGLYDPRIRTIYEFVIRYFKPKPPKKSKL